MSDAVRPRRWQPTRLLRPWDSPGKNTGVGCHFLLQCMKVKSESEVAQSCPTLSDPMDCGLPGSSHGIFQARVLEWGAIQLANNLFPFGNLHWKNLTQHYQSGFNQRSRPVGDYIKRIIVRNWFMWLWRLARQVWSLKGRPWNLWHKLKLMSTGRISSSFFIREVWALLLRPFNW